MITVARSQYAYALGYNVALASLSNVENTYLGFNRRISSGKVYPVGITSVPVNPYPVRRKAQGGKESGDGEVDHAWLLTFGTYGLRQWLINLFTYSTTPTNNIATTINTRRHELDTYTRYNAIAILPTFGEDGDAVYLGKGIWRLRQRFNALVAI